MSSSLNDGDVDGDFGDFFTAGLKIQTREKLK